MNSAEILEALHKKQLNFTVIADALDVTPQHVSCVAKRIATNRRVARAFSTALDLPVEEIFPDRPDYLKPPVPHIDREARAKDLRKQLAA